MTFLTGGRVVWGLIPIFIFSAYLLYSCIDNSETASDEDMYAGSVRCIECHEKFYQLWAPSHHGLAMQTINADFIYRYFPDINSDKIRVDSSLFHVRNMNDSLKFIEEKGEAINTYPAVYALGGKNVFYFLTPFEKGRLQVLPLAYDLNKQEWYNNPESAVRGFEVDYDEVLPWKHIGFTFNTSCFSCHVSQLTNNFDLGSNTYQTDWKEDGINCETCHGPSKEHIKACQEAGEGNVPEDLKIIKTTVFTSDQHNSSCSSCHSKMRPITPSYIPGERFFDHFDLVTLENADFYPDGRDLGENYTLTTWLQSSCVKNSDINCIDCHTSSGRYRFAKENPNGACMPCHESNVKQVEAHSHHPSDSEGSLCISCHMPMTEFARMHRSDHSMRPPSPQASKEFGSPNACNNCHDDKSNEWADEKLKEWGKSEHQEKIVENGRLIKEAREENWKRLDQMLWKLEEKQFDEIFSASMIRLLRPCPEERKWETLLKLVSHESPLVRSALATTFTDWHTLESVGELKKMCSDDYRVVRISAAQALSSMPDQLTEDIQSKSYFDALNEYIVSITARPDDYASHATLGNFYFNREDYDMAIRHFNYSTRLYPENTGAYVNCGFVHTLQGNLGLAEAQFKKALSYDPRNEGANLNYALLLGEMGRIEEARNAFEKVLEINPESAVAAYNLSVIVSSKDTDLAIDYAKKAVRFDPENPKYQYTLAYFHFQKGSNSAAQRVLEEMIRKFRYFGDAYMLLYEIYSRTGQAGRAAQLAREASANTQLHESYRMRFKQLMDGSM